MLKERFVLVFWHPPLLIIEFLSLLSIFAFSLSVYLDVIFTSLPICYGDAWPQPFLYRLTSAALSESVCVSIRFLEYPVLGSMIVPEEMGFWSLVAFGQARL